MLPTAHWLGRRLHDAPTACATIPNLPTEEVFTTPDPAARRGSRHVDEAARAARRHDHSRPARAFEGGRAVEIDADENGRGAAARARVDDGAPRLGELALVDRQGRIGPLGTVFYNTLLDENAASHIALGSGFPFVVEDEDDRARVQRERRRTSTS